MNYELTKKLKEAGFPIKIETHRQSSGWEEYIMIPPTLSELIEACGERFGFLLLNQENKMWLGREKGIEPIHPEFSGYKHYETPEEAVANLWLKLNKKIK